MGTTEKIITAVYAAMQAAEEIGGPEGEEYIDLMEQISREAGERAIRARKITPALVMPEDFDFASN